jgi:nucleoside-diphosphate-sugar epimerase
MRRTALHGARVLVTGATGFIGSRLVERLVVEEGAAVRALVRDFSRAPRIARFPIEMVPGDIASPTAVDAAVAGCDYVFHCAYGNSGDDTQRKQTTVAGTETVLEAALRHRCRRVVHASTFSVYGDPPAGDVAETAPRRYTGNAYGDSKIDAERRALAYCARGLSVAAVQPTIVYGPFATTWTVRPLEQLQAGGMLLINDGAGVCNAVYVDDVVEAMVSAATTPAAHGEAFLISAAEPTTWRTFFESYRNALGRGELLSVTAEEARTRYDATLPKGFVADTLRVLTRESRRRDAVIRTRLRDSAVGFLLLRAAEAGGLLPRPGVPAEPPPAAVPQPLHPSKVPMFVSTARVRIDKARRVLGFAPQFDLERGMAMTTEWARWANLI